MRNFAHRNRIPTGGWVSRVGGEVGFWEDGEGRCGSRGSHGRAQDARSSWEPSRGAGGLGGGDRQGPAGGSVSRMKPEPPESPGNATRWRGRCAQRVPPDSQVLGGAGNPPWLCRASAAGGGCVVPPPPPPPSPGTGSHGQPGPAARRGAERERREMGLWFFPPCR